MHIEFGTRSGGRYQPARVKGLVAIGDIATGLVAIGPVAAGAIAVGVKAVGVVSLALPGG